MDKYRHRFALSFAGLLLLLNYGSIAQASVLSISSATVSPGGVASLSVTLSVSGTAPAGLAWAITYSTAQIAGIVLTPGPLATAAGKTLACMPVSGGAMCVLSGLNSSAIGSGVVAYISATMLPGATTAS